MRIWELFGINTAQFIMPVMGLEPIRGCPQQILSLPRLPIPTHRLNKKEYSIFFFVCQLDKYISFYRSTLYKTRDLLKVSLKHC